MIHTYSKREREREREREMVPHDVASRVIRRLAAGCKSRRDSHSEAFPLAEHIVYAWYDEACDRQKFHVFF